MQRIGIVGATTPTLASITSTGNITVRPAGTDVDALAAEIQPAVDALLARAGEGRVEHAGTGR